MALLENSVAFTCLALHGDGIPITVDKIATMVKATNVDVEGYWPGLIAKLVSTRNVDDLIMNMGVAGGGAALVAVASSGGAPAAAAPSPVEEKEESDDEMGFGLFDD